MGNKELIGINLGAENLKIAHLRISAHKREVVNLFSREIKDMAEEEIAKLIRTTVAGFKLKNPNFITVIEPSSVITKNIEIPSINPQEIKNIIDLQAGRHTPYSREEIIIDYIDIGQHRQNYSKILLIIVARSIIKRQFDILHRAGVRFQKTAFVSEGLSKFISRISRIDTQHAPVAIMHIDQNISDFTVVFKEKPVFVRNISIGTRHLKQEREKYQMRFVDEIKKSLEAYQSEDIEKSPHTIIITGIADELKELTAVLNNNLHIPSKTVSYFKNLAVSSKVADRDGFAQTTSFLGTISPLFFIDDLKADLIPEEAKLSKTVEERGRELIKTGILILTFFVLVFMTLLSKIYFKSTYLERLDKKYKNFNDEANLIESDFTKIGLIKNYISNRGYSLEVLSTLFDVTPVNLMIVDIKFDIQGTFSIKGTAESMSTVFSLVDKMEKTKYFKDVKTRYTTKRKDGLKDVTDFEIVTEIDKEE